MFNTTINVTVDTAQGVQAVNRLSQSVGQFDRDLGRADNKLREFERGIGSFRRAILGLQSAFLGFGAMNLVRDLIKVNMEFDRVRFALLAGANSAAAAAADFTWLRQETQKLGLPLNKVGNEYAKLTANAQNTALQGQPVRDVFISVSKSAQALGLDISTTQRIFMALSQMLSKGRVQAEEARQQFGEHLPGGFKALAKAAGFADNELGKFQEALRKGSVDAIQMLMNLPKVLDEKFGPAFEAALISSPQMAVNRFKAMFANLAYDIGQGGFMKEFVGLLRDMENALTSDRGRREIERLTKTLSLLMHAVRQVSNFIMNNLNSVLAVTIGLIGSYAVLGLRNMVLWLGRVAGVSGGLIGVLTNPWLLFAAAIGGAVAWVVRFGDEMVAVGKYKAHGLDWVKGFFDVLNEDMRTAALNMSNWLMQFPALQGVLAGAVRGWAGFQTALSNGKSFQASLGEGFSRFMETLKAINPGQFKALTDFFSTVERFGQKAAEIGATIRDGLFAGLVNMMQELKPAVQPLLDLGARIGTLIITPLGAAWALVKNIANSTNDWATTVASALAVFGEKLGGAFAKLGIQVVRVFNFVLNVVGTALTKLNTWLNSTFNNGEQINWWRVLGAVALGALNIIVGAVNGVAVAIKVVMDVVEILARSFGPLIGQVAKTVGDVFAKLKSGAESSAPVLDLIALVFVGIYETIKAVIQIATFLFSLIGRTLGPIIDGVGMAIEGVIMAINGVIIGMTTFGRESETQGAKAAGAMEQGRTKTEEFKRGVIKFGDVFLGVIVTTIQAVGLLIKILGAAVSAVIQLAERLDRVSGAAGEWVNGLLTFNFEKMAQAGEKIKSAITDPLENIDTKEIMEALGKDVSANFHIVTDAVKDAADVGNALDAGVRGFAAGYTQITPSAIQAQAPEIQATAAQLGGDEAQAYMTGFSDRWGQAASERTRLAEEEKARIRKQQEELAKAQAAAWEKDNAAVDRTQRPAALENGGGSRRKTTAEKAADLIAELEAKTKNAEELIAQLNMNPHQDPAMNKAYEAAQSALRRVGYDMSVQDALGGKGGAVAEQLAKAAVEANNYADALNRAQKVVDTIFNNDQAIKGLQDQVRLSQDVNVTSGEYNAILKAQDALRKHDLDLTYEQAMATDEHGRALNTQAYNLAQSAYEQEIWNQKASAAVQIASQLRQYAQLSDEMGALTLALQQGQGALDRTSAEIAAQRVVMDAYGDEVFDATRLNDANTASVYAMAQAYAQMGGSLENAIRLMKDLSYEAQAVTDPMGAARARIGDEAASQQSVLDGFMNAATIKYQNDMSNAMGEADPSTHIQLAIDEYNQARVLYEQAIADLQTVTNDKLLRESNNVFDALKVAMIDFGKDAENIGGKMQDIFSSAFNGMADELTNFVMTGKADFKSLALSIIADIQKMIIKWLMWQAIKAAANAMGFPIPFESGGVMGPSGPSGIVPPPPDMPRNPWVMYASGGVMTEYGNVPMRRYGRGGIAKTPQMALFGEGSGSEAYVPLPDGRSIPVTLNMENYHDTARYGGGGGGPTTVNVDTTIIVEGGNGQVNNGDPEGSQKMAETISRRVNAELRNQVIGIIADELRPGGTFNKMGSNRSRF